MAWIDKIYGNEKQYREFYWWIEKHMFRIMLFTRVFFFEGTLPYNHIYDYVEWLHWKKERVITNFPTSIDIYLMLFCRIWWVRKKLERQYWKINIINIIKIWIWEYRYKIKYK